MQDLIQDKPSGLDREELGNEYLAIENWIDDPIVCDIRNSNKKQLVKSLIIGHVNRLFDYLEK
jgi:hypothetical protein